MAFNPRDPDEAIVATFKNYAIPNEAKSNAAGRLICDDVEHVEIRFPGRRDWQPFPATAFSHWATDPHTGAQRKVTYAERFPRQYRQFKEQQTQTKSGTPLTHAPFLTEGRRAELRALNIYTVEALAQLDGQELKNLGNGGRDLKNAAQDYIEETKARGVSLQVEQELQALRARNLVLEDDNAALKKAQLANGSAEFDDMSDEQLRDYVKTHSGHAPQGSLGRKTLLRMAADVKPKAAA